MFYDKEQIEDALKDPFHGVPRILSGEDYDRGTLESLEWEIEHLRTLLLKLMVYLSKENKSLSSPDKIISKERMIDMIYQTQLL